MSPRLNFYRQSQQPVATPAVRSRPNGDLYVNLMAFERDGSQATLRVLYEPLVGWIWVGGAVVAFGAVLSLWPGRRRRRPRELVVPDDDALPDELEAAGAVA
jgi:cytochrome c-type biogenesis protein CcmF